VYSGDGVIASEPDGQTIGAHREQTEGLFIGHEAVAFAGTELECVGANSVGLGHIGDLRPMDLIHHGESV
jgi:hypothetical protein